jgi:hypothetical protein
VREGRAARLAAVQQHMADGSSNRDQQLQQARGSSDYGGGGVAGGYSSSSGGRAAIGRLSPGRNALRGIGGRDGRGSSLAGSSSGLSGVERTSSGGGADWRSAGVQILRPVIRGCCIRCRHARAIHHAQLFAMGASASSCIVLHLLQAAIAATSMRHTTIRVRHSNACTA